MRMLVLLAALLFATAAQAQSLQSLSWLKGCWRTQGNGPVITEVWLDPPMPAMMGYSYTTHEGETQSWEQMRIEMTDGVLRFVAMPNGAAPTRFDLAESGDDYVVFENPTHDYPRRITYGREGALLTATLSSLPQVPTQAFAYRRIRCESALRP